MSWWKERSHREEQGPSRGSRLTYLFMDCIGVTRGGSEENTCVGSAQCDLLVRTEIEFFLSGCARSLLSSFREVESLFAICWVVARCLLDRLNLRWISTVGKKGAKDGRNGTQYLVGDEGWQR